MLKVTSVSCWVNAILCDLQPASYLWLCIILPPLQSHNTLDIQGLHIKYYEVIPIGANYNHHHST